MSAIATGKNKKIGMVQINQILGNIDLWHYSVWHPHPLWMGMVMPLMELCHPQAFDKLRWNAAPFDFAFFGYAQDRQGRLEDATQG
jgi:hypothetical protein